MVIIRLSETLNFELRFSDFSLYSLISTNNIWNNSHSRHIGVHKIALLFLIALPSNF
jgi:hypothetical protein